MMTELSDYWALGELVRRSRRKNHLTQDQLAQSIGVDSSYIAKIENGKARGSYEILGKISQALEIPWLQVVEAGALKIPHLHDEKLSSISPLLDDMFTMYSPTLKEVLIDIAQVLRKHIPSMG